MQIIYGNMFDLKTYRSSDDTKLTLKPDVFAITTNGFVKSNGEAVMGRGCAKMAATKFKDLPHELGTWISCNGNHVWVINSYMPSENSFARRLSKIVNIVSFPVKSIAERCLPDKSNVVVHMRSKYNPDDTVPGWACRASLTLIEQSTIELKDLIFRSGCWSCVVLPRPGCGAGELDWKDVKPILEKHLDDRFYVISLRKDK